MPIEVQKFLKFNQFCLLFCWKTDDLQIFGRLPVRGYCPGQTMNLKLDVVNKSLREVLYFLVHFIQVRKIFEKCIPERVVCVCVLTSKKFISFSLLNSGSHIHCKQRTAKG